MEQDWQSKALQTFQELEDEIHDNQQGPIGLWIELSPALTEAYETNPPNDDLIGRIYDYANWCFQRPPTSNVETYLASAAGVNLIEDIPLNQAIAADLYRWVSVESFEGFENLFR